MNCKKCGAELDSESLFCEECGTKVVRETNPKTFEDSKVAIGNMVKALKDTSENTIEITKKKIEESGVKEKLTGVSINKENDTSIICKRCGKKLPGDSEFCTECGESILTNNLVCPTCGTPYEEGLKFCRKCGCDFSKYEDGKLRCDCGFLLESQDDFCPSCGKKVERPDVKKQINNRQPNNIQGQNHQYKQYSQTNYNTKPKSNKGVIIGVSIVIAIVILLCTVALIGDNQYNAQQAYNSSFQGTVHNAWNTISSNGGNN